MSLGRLEWTSTHGAALRGLCSSRAPQACAASWAGSCTRSPTSPARKASSQRGASSDRLSSDCTAVHEKQSRHLLRWQQGPTAPQCHRCCADARCQLTAYLVGRRFREESGLNSVMAAIFESICTGTLNASLPVVRCMPPPCYLLPSASSSHAARKSRVSAHARLRGVPAT